MYATYRSYQGVALLVAIWYMLLILHIADVIGAAESLKRYQGHPGILWLGNCPQASPRPQVSSGLISSSQSIELLGY